MLICMSQEGFEKNVGSFAPGGLLDLGHRPGQYRGAGPPAWTAYHIPATRFAEKLGNKMMANIVMLGFLSALSDLVRPDSLRQAVLSSVPAKTERHECHGL